jgi:hypothetical protein
MKRGCKWQQRRVDVAAGQSPELAGGRFQPDRFDGTGLQPESRTYFEQSQARDRERKEEPKLSSNENG